MRIQTDSSVHNLFFLKQDTKIQGDTVLKLCQINGSDTLDTILYIQNLEDHYTNK